MELNVPLYTFFSHAIQDDHKTKCRLQTLLTLDRPLLLHTIAVKPINYEGFWVAVKALKLRVDFLADN